MCLSGVSRVEWSSNALRQSKGTSGATFAGMVDYIKDPGRGIELGSICGELACVAHVCKPSSCPQYYFWLSLRGDS
jgi:hypothetical protein